MEEKFLLKMLKNSFLQYGQNLNESPLPKDDYIHLLRKIIADKDDDTEWYEVIEDVVYAYLTNQK